MKFSQKGFSLLEILVSVSLFAIMTVFISQLVRMSLKQQNKLEDFAKGQRQISAVTKIMLRDFKNVNLFFDYNKSLSRVYRLKGVEPSGQRTQAGFQDNSSEFDFVGNKQEVMFPALSLRQRSSYQQIYIKYFLKDCTDLEEEQVSSCLYRSILDVEDNNKIIEKIVLLRGIKSLEFSYYDTEQKSWKPEWEAHPKDILRKLVNSSIVQFGGDNNRNSFNSQQSSVFPVAIKMDIEWEDSKVQKRSYEFPVSYPLFSYQGSFRLMNTYSQLLLDNLDNNFHGAKDLQETKEDATTDKKENDENKAPLPDRPIINPRERPILPNRPNANPNNLPNFQPSINPTEEI